MMSDFKPPWGQVKILLSYDLLNTLEQWVEELGLLWKFILLLLLWTGVPWHKEHFNISWFPGNFLCIQRWVSHSCCNNGSVSSYFWEHIHAFVQWTVVLVWRVGSNPHNHFAYLALSRNWVILSALPWNLSTTVHVRTCIFLCVQGVWDQSIWVLWLLYCLLCLTPKFGSLKLHSHMLKCSEKPDGNTVLL